MNKDVTFVELILLMNGALWGFSSLLYSLSNILSDAPDDKWAWFSRALGSMICFGFYGVIKAIKDGKA